MVSFCCKRLQSIGREARCADDATALRDRGHRRPGRDVRPGHRASTTPTPPSWSRSPTPTRPGWPRTTRWLAGAGRRAGADLPGRPTSPRCSTKERVDAVAGDHRRRDPRRVHRRRAGRRLRRDHREADDHRRAALPAHPRRGRGAPAGGSRSPSTTATTRCTSRCAQLLADGEIGEIGSVHFEWLLDVRHGADYFRRWHRDKANSGGLLVHKASHHFDLVNWWLGARAGRGLRVRPAVLLRRARAPARLRPRLRPRPRRTRGRADDPFALHLADNPRCARSTSTPRPTTATTATATSSRPA